MNQAYRALIDSPRVSARTRALLLARAALDGPAYRPAALSIAQLATLRAVLGRVLPQGQAPIDLAARIDAQLADGAGDGWRFACLPPDAAAYCAALDTLDAGAEEGRAFVQLDNSRQDALLQQAADGALAAPGGLDPQQMRLWFEDLRADAVRTYVAHPATLARMGYSGIGYGGDGDKAGFLQLGPDEREAWEPLAEPDAPR